jgi:23S rRNA pseudouridine2605 synthase
VLLIEAGRVRVDGVVVRGPARRIDPRKHKVQVDGHAVGDETERVVLALNKPVGYITSRHDPQGRPTVYDLIEGWGRWVFPIGRLDQDSSGLLLLTNDHRLGQRLSDPEAHVPKTYHVMVDGVPTPESLDVLRHGLTLPDGTMTRPARVRLLGSRPSGRSWMEIILRRMCAQVGHDVQALTRVAVGALELGDLGSGEWRRLTPREVVRLVGPTSLRRGRKIAVK